jgi:uncharacterized phage-associated protein
MLSCFDVADYFIWLAQDTGSFISNLKLQKLVYYAQAWHLALQDEPLFEEDFEAWVHGPVIATLYKKYKAFGWQPILTEVEPQIDKHTSDFLSEVAEEYFACDAYELEQMTHAEEPWQRARKGLPSDAVSTAIIEKNWMREYYGARVEENSENQTSSKEHCIQN